MATTKSVQPVKKPEVIVRLNGVAKTIVLHQSKINKLPYRAIVETIVQQWSEQAQGGSRTPREESLGKQMLEHVAKGAAPVEAAVKAIKGTKAKKGGAK